MFDSVRNNKKIVQLVLAIIILPFALWGVDSYVRGGRGSNELATVGGSPIASEEFQRALSQQQERLRPQLGGNANKLLESMEFRRGVLQELINQRLLLLYAGKGHLAVGDGVLRDVITSQPSLQVDGKFSRERYEALVASQNMSVEQFEALLRRDLLLQQASLPVANAALAGRLSADRWLMAQLEEREVAAALVRADQFAGATPDAEAVKRYYEENRARFEQPEQLRVDYLVLSQDRFVREASVDEAAIKAWYEANAARYVKPEQRRASHILLRLDKNASEGEAKAAAEKAAQILDQLKANSGDFAKLAKQHSQDPGSAANGGDLGFFGRGMMVKPFEEAAFALREDQVSEPVRSDFGIHIIRLTGIRPQQAQKLDEVRDEIIAELKRQAGAKRYAEAAENFANIVYEQPDSLQPAAEKFALKVQSSDWLAKGGALPEPFANEKLAQAIFGEDAIKNRRNTEAIETAPTTLVAARVAEHRPAAVLPLEQVAGTIAKALQREAGLAQAATAGQAALEKLRRGESAALSWSTVRPVSRMAAQDLDEASRAAIFHAATDKLPAFVGVKVPAGFALYRIDGVKPFDAAVASAPGPADMLRQQYQQLLAQEEMFDWLAALRGQYEVKINSAALERR